MCGYVLTSREGTDVDQLQMGHIHLCQCGDGVQVVAPEGELFEGGEGDVGDAHEQLGFPVVICVIMVVHRCSCSTFHT
jgi:D-alanine-D-alanine ligase-like ATP-grasp enzyme